MKNSIEGIEEGKPVGNKVEQASVRSKQPRFQPGTSTDSGDVFMQFMQVVDELELTEPAYKADSRYRDRWLGDFIKKEPHLNGVINSVTSIDKNRGWRVVGGRNQVNRITKMLHSFTAAPSLIGWRPALSAASKAYWTSDLGTIVELGREGKNGPVRGLYNADPTKFSLTGDIANPIKYHPPRGKIYSWADGSFFRVSSLIDLQEEYLGLGYCAVSRCVELAKLTIALFRHDEEKLLARAPRGLLLLSGIKKDQWDNAMASYKGEMDAEELKYYGAVAVLASAAQSVDGKFLSLSELPTSFNIRDWMDMLLYGYALCFGYDPSEFWPVQYGALGRGNETQIQHEKATGKGRLDFVLGFQEQLQNFLPETIDFAFDQRDEQGDLLHAQVNKAWADVVKEMAETQCDAGNLISQDEARVIAADYGLIPSAWSPVDDVQSTDQDEADNDPEIQPKEGEEEVDNPVSASPTANAKTLRMHRETQRRKVLEKVLLMPSVWQAAQKFPMDQIVEYSYPSNTLTVLWDHGEEIFRKGVYSVIKPRVEATDENGKPLIVSPNITINMPQERETQLERPRRMEKEGAVGGATIPEINIYPQINVPPQEAPTVNVDVNVPEQPTPVVNVENTVNVPEQTPPTINVQPSDVKVELTAEQPAPIVNVTVPETKVEINVPESPAPVINVQPSDVEIVMPEPETEVSEVERDAEGRIVRIKKKAK